MPAGPPKKELVILNRYFRAFSASERKGRFFRKLTLQKCELRGTNVLVGKNTAAQFARQIATKLNLDPSSYTSHALKRTDKLTFILYSNVLMYAK